MPHYFRIVTATLFCLVSLSASSGQSAGDTTGLLKVHLDMRTSLSQNRRLRMGGTSVGWEWGKKRDEITVGYYWTGKRGRNDVMGLRNFDLPFQLPAGTSTDIRFVSLGYWLTLHDWRRWKLSSPIEAGLGRAKFTAPFESGTGHTERMRIFPLQLAMYGEWKATRWLGTGLQAGYRYYFNNHGIASLKPVSGMYYRIRVLVYMQTFYDWRNHIFRKEPLKSPFY
ncbi:hypothetical protein [Ravibacter arvi]